MFPGVVTLFPSSCQLSECLLTCRLSLRRSAAVHGQGEGRGDVAQQTDVTEAGETHGESRQLKRATSGIPSGPGTEELFSSCYHF